MTIVIKKVKRMTAARPTKQTASSLRGKILPMLKARQKSAFLTGASSGIGKAARQVAFARGFVPRALFHKILRPQFGLA